MKVLTMTFHNHHNYGAVAQSYALQVVLKSLGYETELIDYHEKRKSYYKKVFVGFNRQTLVNNYVNINLTIGYLKYKRAYDKFERFIDEELDKTCMYDTLEALNDTPPEADAYLVGSDQVWGFDRQIIKAFFLPFVKRGVKISYAASAGNCRKTNYNEKLLREIVPLIKAFDQISLREKIAKDFFEEQYGVKSQLHLDPVFLLKSDEWKGIMSTRFIEGDYILCYQLVNNSLVKSVLKRLKELSGLKIVSIQRSPTSRVYGDVILKNVGPKEFVRLFSDSKIVVTTSFHGTAFGIIFQKEMYVCNNSASPMRIEHLLKVLNLNSRNIKALEQIDKEYKQKIDYSIVDEILEKERDRSINYLQNIEKMVSDKRGI